MTANCTARDSKEKLLKEMKFLKMNDKETVQVFLTRANTLRQKLRDNCIETDDFHFRNTVEQSLKKKANTAEILRAVLMETGSQEYSVLKFFDRLRTVEYAHSTSSSVPRGQANVITTKKNKKRKTKSLNAAAGKKKNKKKDESDESDDSDEEPSSKKMKKVEKELAFLKGKIKGLQKGKSGKGNKSWKGKGGRGDSWVSDITKKNPLPQFAQPGHMQKYYTDSEWEKRLELLEEGKSPKDFPDLFKKDRWDKRYVCFQCRETGHTMDKCFQL
eukprot:SAG31_NODE_1765_length_7315_cov_58.328991_4_plen_273_part_00